MCQRVPVILVLVNCVCVVICKQMYMCLFVVYGKSLFVSESIHSGCLIIICRNCVYRRLDRPRKCVARST